jgi:hypothetical protein
MMLNFSGIGFSELIATAQFCFFLRRAWCGSLNEGVMGDARQSGISLRVVVAPTLIGGAEPTWILFGSAPLIFFRLFSGLF